MHNRWHQSLYIKIFLSFLATCILFFVGLAVFWNFWFSDLFYKEKKALLVSRMDEVKQIVRNYEEGAISTREVNFGLRLIARSFNGQAWIVDVNGVTLVSSDGPQEGQRIPNEMSDDLVQAKRNNSGFSITHFEVGSIKQKMSLLSYYSPIQLQNQQMIIFLHTPVEDINEIIATVRFNIGLPLLFSLIAVGVILYTLSRKLTGPLQQMNKAALSLAEGNFLTRVHVSSSDEIGQLANSFNFMAEQLKQWEDTRQEFLTNISHELRSPLTILRGLIVGMSDKVIPVEEQPRYLEICDQEVQRLQRLVNELLDLARIQNQMNVFDLAPIDIMEKSKNIIDLIAPVIEDHGLRLEVWIPFDYTIPPIVELDADRYAQILHNLIYNAIQFTPSGNKIKITLRIEDQLFSVVILDEGLGMSEAEMNRMWERFYKADPSRGNASEGTGLGLTIVRHLVLGMNGTISVHSVLGQGSEFTVSFPLHVKE
ncbi:MAG: HAMP domain-containing sensor histidine kinase [Paenibacillaceae bacterium]